ncbi:CGNR zinc finger domain-containing protein [Actinoplanes sp. URMC 104]|uniref:CGNR zinc finger domain-containing protein n=1 Tax=Actinoplanes sp. URMC 104 TaxID=3423409 RepID=UPI003F1A3186
MTSDEAGGTRRLGLPPAPGGLCVVQDLLNTAAIAYADVPDLLDDEAPARLWLATALQTWAAQTGQPAPELSVARRDLVPLRALRGRLRDWLAKGLEDDEPRPVRLGLSLAESGVGYRPDDLASLVHVEVLLASRTGTLARLKTCQNPACGAAFYDLSRNGTRVWHDMKTCGNAMNLRASRARRRV